MTKEAFPAVSVYMLGTNNWPRLLEQDFLCGHEPDDLGAGRGISRCEEQDENRG